MSLKVTTLPSTKRRAAMTIPQLVASDLVERWALSPGQ